MNCEVDLNEIEVNKKSTDIERFQNVFIMILFLSFLFYLQRKADKTEISVIYLI